MLIKLAQHFDTLESGGDASETEPAVQADLTLSHTHGVRVKLYSRSNS
jgi:hypothetical protein